MNLTPIFKLLSDESRLRVIYLLSKEELCVCELVGILELSQPKISKVLSKLRDMDLVEDKRREKFVFYRLKEINPMLNQILSFISTNTKEYPTLLEDLNRLKKKHNYIDKCSLVSLREMNL